MTIEEHKLMIVMFTRQAMLLKALTDILGSNGLLAEGDIKMFDAYQQTPPSTLKAMKLTAELYSQVATKLGLDVPLESL